MRPPVRSFTVARGVVYAAAFVATWAWLAAAARRLDPRIGIVLPAAFAPAGVALAALGAVLAALCVATFLARGDGTPAPFDPPRAFVVAGPYRHTRNPMYLGGFAVLVGSGLALRSPAIVLLAAAFLGFAHLLVVVHEEPTLRARFGQRYEAYRRAVPRWRVRRRGWSPPAGEG